MFDYLIINKQYGILDIKKRGDITYFLIEYDNRRNLLWCPAENFNSDFKKHFSKVYNLK